MLKVEKNEKLFKAYSRLMCYQQKKIIMEAVFTKDFKFEYKNESVSMDAISKIFFKELLLENSDLDICKIVSADSEEMQKIIRKYLRFIKQYYYQLFQKAVFTKDFKKNVLIWKNPPRSGIEKLISSITNTHELAIQFKRYIKNSNLKKEALVNQLLENDKSFFDTFVSNIFIKSTLYKALYYIFVTHGYSKVFFNFDYKFIKRLNIKTCPYCNRNYISVLERTDSGNITRPQVDHFYPKSIFPILAVSYYNLVPSCGPCNLMKGSKNAHKDRLKSPYLMQENDFKFKWKPKNGFLYLKSLQNQGKLTYKDENKIEIILETTENVHNEYFELSELYKQHQDIAIEVLLTKIENPISYLYELAEFDSSFNEVYRSKYGSFYDYEDFHLRPLSKLKKDIALDLGIDMMSEI